MGKLRETFLKLKAKLSLLTKNNHDMDQIDYDNLLGFWEGKPGTATEDFNIRVISVDISRDVVKLISGEELSIHDLRKSYQRNEDVPLAPEADLSAFSTFVDKSIKIDHLADEPRIMTKLPPKNVIVSDTRNMVRSAIAMSEPEKVSVNFDFNSNLGISKIKALISMFGLNEEEAVDEIINSDEGKELVSLVVKQLLSNGNNPEHVVEKVTKIKTPRKSKRNANQEAIQ